MGSGDGVGDAKLSSIAEGVLGAAVAVFFLLPLHGALNECIRAHLH